MEEKEPLRLVDIHDKLNETKAMLGFLGWAHTVADHDHCPLSDDDRHGSYLLFRFVSDGITAIQAGIDELLKEGGTA